MKRGKITQPTGQDQPHFLELLSTEKSYFLKYCQPPKLIYSISRQTEIFKSFVFKFII